MRRDASDSDSLTRRLQATARAQGTRTIPRAASVARGLCWALAAPT